MDDLADGPGRPIYPASPIGEPASVALVLAYLVVAIWGGAVLTGENVATPLVWPASGIGLALVLVRGVRVWPVILVLGAAAAVISAAYVPLPTRGVTGLFSGIGAALEAVLAGWLIWRLVGEDYLERASALVLATLVALPIAAFVSAIPLVVGKLVAGAITTFSWAGTARTWHAAGVSDLMGMLTLTPPILLWVRDPRLDLGLREAAELAALLIAAGLVLAFPEPAQTRYLLVAIHLGIALRFPLKWAAAAVGLVSLIYLWRSTLDLRQLPGSATYAFFLQEVIFVVILNIATYVVALLQHEARSRNRQLCDLVRELGSAEQRERERLAQTLHDHFQQQLVAAQIAMGQWRGGDQDAADRADARVREAIQDARTLSVELHPPALDLFGFTGALEWLGEDSSRTYGLQVEVEGDADPGAPDVAAFLFQSVRELVLNVVKHANANRVWIRLRQDGGWLEVSVEDNGSGWDPETEVTVSHGHFGLFTIRQRIALLGGRLDMASGKRRTRIALRVPITGESERL